MSVVLSCCGLVNVRETGRTKVEGKGYRDVTCTITRAIPQTGDSYLRNS